MVFLLLQDQTISVLLKTISISVWYLQVTQSPGWSASKNKFFSHNDPLKVAHTLGYRPYFRYINYPTALIKNYPRRAMVHQDKVIPYKKKVYLNHQRHKKSDANHLSLIFPSTVLQQFHLRFDTYSFPLEKPSCYHNEVMIVTPLFSTYLWINIKLMIISTCQWQAFLLTQLVPFFIRYFSAIHTVSFLCEYEYNNQDIVPPDTQYSPTSNTR